MGRDDICVRRVRNMDDKLVADCGRIASEYSPARWPAETLRYDVNVHGRPLFVAEDAGGEVCGFIAGHHGKGVGEITALYVRSDMLRFGVGTRLLAQMESCLGQCGAGRVLLLARPTAVSFYLARGYVHDSVLKNFLQKSL